MFQYLNSSSSTILLALTLTLLSAGTLMAQEEGIRPEWWFGAGIGLNYNIYSTEIKTLNASIPALVEPFTKGSGLGLNLGLLLEYRPTAMWGGTLNVGFDGRGGDFDDVASHKLSTSMNYLSIEPNLRFTPFGRGLHIVAGPRLGFSVAKSFAYTPPAGTEQKEDWSDVRGTNFGGQLGVGYDIPLSSPDAAWQVELTPFVSAHFGQGLRSIEKWNTTTLRGGVAVKFGSTTEARRKAETVVSFSVRSPQIVPKERRVAETFPMRNYMFFDESSARIPARYIQLTAEEAVNFKEEHLLEPSKQLLTGRSARQMQVYYNLVNIIGDRMRKFPYASIELIGASEKGADDGRLMAESVKEYLVNVFGISSQRITTRGQVKPAIPSHQPGGTRELDLVKAEDRRVDITSETLDLLLPVSIISLQEDPLDADVVLNVSGADQLLASWNVEATDERGSVKRFGPFTGNQERIPGGAILGDRMEGNYRVTMIGVMKDGATLHKEQSIRLVRSEGPEEQMGLRFSILFEFDQSKTVATYDRFLRETVVPTIPEGANVIIHGHTDIVGEESHNLKLSRERATETMNVLQQGLAKVVPPKAGRVKFDTFGFGEDIRRAPFENRLPEERFYNRTVIIDIVPH